LSKESCYDGEFYYGNLDYYPTSGPGGSGIVKFDIKNGRVADFLNSSDVFGSDKGMAQFMIACSASKPGVVYVPVYESKSNVSLYAVNVNTKSATPVAENILPSLYDALYTSGSAFDTENNRITLAYILRATDSVTPVARKAERELMMHNKLGFYATDNMLATVDIATGKTTHAVAEVGKFIDAEMYSITYDAKTKGVYVAVANGTQEQRYDMSLNRVDTDTGAVSAHYPIHAASDGIGFTDHAGVWYTTYNIGGVTGQMRQMLSYDLSTGQKVADVAIGDGQLSDWTVVDVLCT